MSDLVKELNEAVAERIRDGQTLMIAGFGRGGTPFTLIEHLAEHHAHLRGLTLVKNDANESNLGIGVLLARGMARRLISTHIGLNPDAIAMMNRGELEVEFVPQGIFAERIRAGGAGLPAFLTDIGMGTIVAKGKPTVELDGRTLLVERALRGDVALLCADIADRMGNCWWRGSNRNMSVAMGTACDAVIVEAREIVEPGAIEPENVHLPGVFVDAVVQAQPRKHMQS
ncbi:MAG: acetate CoA/acetoacetate CoA-transferase alpha subunit [Candidatus Sumerlaeota bacterium]|nr:acetate CoA/acetoacetate CoA-transferase alpha subunit [Candidatus Sumerlaeota bacterium]